MEYHSRKNEFFSAFLVKGEDTFSSSDRGGARNFTTGD